MITSASNRVLLVVAHPDDEVIGAGAQLARWPGVRIVTVTNGAPRNGRDAFRMGFRTCEEYARSRREEQLRALAIAGVGESQMEWLDFVDQKTSIRLEELTCAVLRSISSFRPAAIVTHPFEGGHPDHDSTAFAVHCACRIIAQSGPAPPLIMEATSYHNGEGRMVTGQFLPCPNRPPVTIQLTAEESARKRRMFACFRTQAETLKYFSTEREQFRAAPPYDFTCPPHDGLLYYELYDWGVSAAEWRQNALRALGTLGIRPTGAQSRTFNYSVDPGLLFRQAA